MLELQPGRTVDAPYSVLDLISCVNQKLCDILFDIDTEKPKKLLVDLPCTNAPPATQLGSSNGIWVYRYHGIDLVSQGCHDSEGDSEGSGDVMAQQEHPQHRSSSTSQRNTTFPST
jgi:hypothetical protein